MARYRSSTDTTARLVGVAFVATLWLGLLLGVSFLATPVKFQAPSLTLATALEVGRATFALLIRVEWSLAAFLALAVVWARPAPGGRSLWIGVGLMALLLAVQSFGLLPILDERVARIIAAEPPASSWHHWAYVAVEAAKALILLAVSLHSLLRLSRGRASL